MKVLLLLAVLLAIAAPAQATTVTNDDAGSGTLLITAEPGEANDLTVIGGPNGEPFTIRDAGAPVRLGEHGWPCTVVDEHTVQCRPDQTEIVIRTLDGDDRLELRGPTPVRTGTQNLGAGDDVATVAFGTVEGDEGDDTLSGPVVDGGPGADRLTVVPGDGPRKFSFTGPSTNADGGPGADVITGAAGDEWLSGGPGHDEVHGGAGDDTLLDADGAGETDEYDGGGGLDTISYYGRRDGVRVDLAAGTGGSVGEGDRLTGLETASGGEGDDVLLGTEGENTLFASKGNDTLDGRGGADTLWDERGDDRMFGGAGRDTIQGGPGADVLDGGLDDDPVVDGGPNDDMVGGGPGADRLVGGEGVDVLDGGDGDDALSTEGDWFRDGIGCGAGRDSVVGDRGGDTADASCEDVTLRPVASMLAEQRLRRGRRVITVRNGFATIDFPPCPPTTCYGSFEFWVGGHKVARGSWGCDGFNDPSGFCARPVDAAVASLPRPIRRRVRCTGGVPAIVLMTLDPGPAGGAIVVRERAILTRSPPGPLEGLAGPARRCR